MFELVPALAKKAHVTDLKLCSVLFEDNALYPWIILVPRVKDIKNMTYLCMEDRLQLMREMALCEEVMQESFIPYYEPFTFYRTSGGFNVLDVTEDGVYVDLYIGNLEKKVKRIKLAD